MKKKSLNYQINGKGKDVVLLHGFLESPSIWEDFVQATEGNFRCINVHLPNHHSPKTSTHFKDLTQQAALLYNTLIQVKAQSPILIGHSLGGYLALAFIEKYPEFASGIALVNATCLADNKEQKKRRTRAINLMKTHPNAFISMAIKNLFAETYLKKHKKEIEKLIANAKKLPIPAIQASLSAMRNRTDTSEVLRNFNKKKLYIYGKHDPLIPLKTNKEAINKSQCPSIALNAGHMCWLEDRENLHGILMEFVYK